MDWIELKKMKGEIALVTIHPEYAFGSSESTQELAVVPANSTVMYEVEMVSFVKVSEVASVYLMSPELRKVISGRSYTCTNKSFDFYRKRNIGT